MGNSIKFNPGITFSAFETRGTLNIDQVELKFLRYHTFCIGLLKLLGKIEDIPIGNGTGAVIHVNKTSLIKRYRDIDCNKHLTDDQILNKVRNTIKELRLSSIKENAAVEKQIQKGPLAGITIQSKRTIRAENLHPRAINLINNFAIYAKNALSQKSSKEIHNAIQHQFKTIRLMNDDGTWKNEALKKADLISSEETALQKGYDFIDKVASCMKENPYFLSAIESLSESQLQAIGKKVERDGMKIFEYVIPYAMALDSVTAAFAKDVHLFDAVDKIWTKEKEPHNLLNYLNIFGAIKYYTLGHLSDFKKAVEQQKVSRDENRDYLTLNIFEAVFADVCIGNKDNAKAGWALMQHPAGGEANPLTGSGPASVDSKARGYPVLELRADLPKEWADLYAVWNLAFCSNSDGFPLLAAKLLIPSVNDYTNNPEGYIHHRAIGLYLYFQFRIFQQIAGEDFSFLNDWHFPDVTKTFGKANAVSTIQYEQGVALAKGAR